MPLLDTIIKTTHRVLDSRVAVRMVDVLDRRSSNRMSELGIISQAFAFKTINRVEGDYFEFGLFRGKTFSFAHRMKRRFKQDDMKLWGFDSFMGLPPIGDRKDNIWNEGEFSCSEGELRKILGRCGLRPDEYVLIAGFYQDSLNEAAHDRLRGRKAAIVYVDCDLYESTRTVLRFVHRYLVNGSILCFDDYYCYKAAPDQGEQRALAEYLSENSDVEVIPYFDYCPVGKAFIVRVH